MEHYGGSNIRVNVRVEVADDFVSGLVRFSAVMKFISLVHSGIAGTGGQLQEDERTKMDDLPAAHECRVVPPLRSGLTLRIRTKHK